MHAPEPTGQLRALDMSDRALAGFGRHLEALKRLAVGYWSYACHPGWALVVDPLVGCVCGWHACTGRVRLVSSTHNLANTHNPCTTPQKWESSTVAEVNEALAEVLGAGDPVAAAEMHLASLAAAQAPMQLAGAATAESLLTLGTPAQSSGNHSAGAVAAAAAAAAAAAGGGGLMLASSTAASAGIWQAQDASGLAGAGSMGLMQGGYAAPMTTDSMAAPGQLGIAGQMLGSMPLPDSLIGASGVVSAVEQLGQSDKRLCPLRRLCKLGAASASCTFITAVHLQMMMVPPPPPPPAAAAAGGQAPGVSPFAAPPLSSMHTSQRTASNVTEHTSDTSGASMGGQGSRAVSRAVSRGAPSAQLQQQPSPGQQLSGVQLGVMQPGQQQQQQQRVASRQITPLLSAQSLMLQQAIAEGWPAPQLKAVLDNMSDHELQQLVDLRCAADAAAGIAPLPAGNVGGLPAQQLQGFGSNLTQPGSTGQQQPGGAAAAAAAAGGAAGKAGGETGISAAAALAALFADAAADDPAALRSMSDVQMAVDQGLLPLDSFTAAGEYPGLKRDLA
jgi:hypothetical protein